MSDAEHTNTMKDMTTTKIEINHDMLTKIKASVRQEKHEALDGVIEAMNEMVNFIENSDRPQTTQHWSGDYLPLIRTKQDFILYRVAGAGQGCVSAAKINLGL